MSVSSVYAAGTPAGTVISNAAKATYTSGGPTVTTNSNTVNVIVAEVINVTVTWQDAANVTVSPGQTNAVLIFKVTNTGNGTEPFLLTGNATVAGDQFDPTLASIYLDTNGNGAYDSGTDTLYVPNVNNPNLAADGFVNVFVLANIPSSGVLDGNLGFATLTAASKTGTGAAGTIFALQGDGGVDAIIGASGGSAIATGKYVISSVLVSINKAATVSDVYGGTRAITGSTIRYSMTVTATGSGTAVGVVITDVIPAYTAYTAGTLKLNAVALTDNKDGDAGDVGGTTAGTVTVSLGNLTSASAVQTIVFNVTIN
ncbi:MAG: hypothetical protein HZB82_05470 [Deltaproteobacteria bacterium]|nr:hypothetical protein [Deltaproteobacteria bacterium]